MAVGEEDSARVVGYFLDKPCIIKMRNPSLLNEEFKDGTQKAGYEVSLFPWIPLSAEKRIPVPADWVVTMVEPTAKLKEMYIEDVVNYGQNNQTDSSDEPRRYLSRRLKRSELILVNPIVNLSILAL